MNTFKINKKEYKAKPFDFNLVCDLEDMGVPIEEMGNKKMSMVRAYFAICSGKGSEFAGSELSAHVINGGSLEDIAKAMGKEMESSDFFRALIETAEESTPKGEE